ncbi:MAG: hypothetical protein WAQ52_08665 [Terriglobales bacterium]
MKRTIVLLTVVLIVGTGCSSRTSAADKCVADARAFVAEVDEHRAEDRLMFESTLGQRPTRDLLDRDDEMISCIAHDPEHRAYYREALDKNDSLESDRFMRYLLDTQQMRDFGQWEEQKRAGAVR